MSTLPSIKDCNGGNCVTHFPQFGLFDQNRLNELLPYCKPDLQSKLVAAKFMESHENFIKACEIYQDNGGGCELYLDLRGGVAEFQPCCR